MQKCYNCGKEVDDNVLICPECGALVRRFTKPAQQIPEPENVPPRSAAYPGAYETPAQESVNVPVYYVTEDGQQLDFQYASCLTNATTQVYANSSVVPWDYLLVKPASGVVDVFVDSMGNASPSEVRFVYAVPEQPTEAPTEVPTRSRSYRTGREARTSRRRICLRHRSSPGT